MTHPQLARVCHADAYPDPHEIDAVYTPRSDGVCNCDTPYHQRRLTLHTCQPGWVKVAYPHHQIPINAAEGRKHTSDPRPCTTSDDEGMKPTSDSHPTKRGSDEGRKRTSNLNPSNDIACRLRAKTNSWQATRQPACLPETIFVYARNYSTKTAFKYHQHPRHPRKPQCFRSLQFYTKKPRVCGAFNGGGKRS